MKHTLTLSKSGMTAVFELQQSGRTFTVLAANVQGRPELSVGFDPKGVEVVLVDSSDAFEVFGISTKVRANGCVLGLDEMRAPDIQTLNAALSSVHLRFWNSEEI